MPDARKDTLNAALEVLNFLHGVGDLEGAGFGDKPPGERSEYWWRKHLGKIHDALAPAAAAPAVGVTDEQLDQIARRHATGTSQENQHG